MTRKHECNGGDCRYSLVAIKRAWVPEFLFAMFKWVAPYQPFRWLLTTPVTK